MLKKLQIPEELEKRILNFVNDEKNKEYIVVSLKKNETLENFLLKNTKLLLDAQHNAYVKIKNAFGQELEKIAREQYNENYKNIHPYVMNQIDYKICEYIKFMVGFKYTNKK